MLEKAAHQRVLRLTGFPRHYRPLCGPTKEANAEGTSDNEDPPQNKRRRGASGCNVNVANSTGKVVSKAKRKEACESLRQFVLAFTLQ